MKSEVVYVRLSGKTIQALDAIAAECRETRSGLIRWMVETMLKQPSSVGGLTTGVQEVESD